MLLSCIYFLIRCYLLFLSALRWLALEYYMYLYEFSSSNIFFFFSFSFFLIFYNFVGSVSDWNKDLLLILGSAVSIYFCREKPLTYSIVAAEEEKGTPNCFPALSLFLELLHSDTDTYMRAKRRKTPNVMNACFLIFDADR